MEEETKHININTEPSEQRLKWVSIKVETPPIPVDGVCECYLVTDNNLIWMAYFLGNEWVFAECTNSNIIIDWTEITHWMECPLTPQEEHQ